MNSDNYFVDPANVHYLDFDRESKIQELKKPVYSKKIKQKKHRRGTGSQFLAISERKLAFKTIQKFNCNFQQIKVNRSKSDIFLQKKKGDARGKSSKTVLGNNLIVQKLQIQKDVLRVSSNVQLKTNNFVINFEKTNQQLKFPHQEKQKQNVIRNYYERIIKTHQNFFIKNEERKLLECNYDSQKNLQKHSDRREGFKLVQFSKQHEIEGLLINQLSQLRKKRNNLLQQAGNSQNYKKQSLIRKNSLFLMNYLKQKQKRNYQDKSPHINYVKNITNHIKIQQNPQIKKILTYKINEKNIFKNKICIQKQDKINAVFNSMKIDPW